MDKDDMALVGFVLSTVLFCIKIYEMWRARYQLSADFASSSDDSMGNLLYLHNLTGRQIVVTHWEVFLARGAWLQRDKEMKVSAEWDCGATPIPAYSSATLRFTDWNHFNVSDRVMKGRKLYVTIHAAGKWSRTIRLLPYRNPLIEAIYGRWRRFVGRIGDDAASF